MSGIAGVLDPGVSNATAWRRSSEGLYEQPDPARSRMVALARLPDLTASATVTLALGVVLARGLMWPTYTTPAGATAVVTINETKGSREFKQTDKSATLTRIYQIDGSKDPIAVAGVGPQVGDVDTTYPGLVCTQRDAEPYAHGDSTAGGTPAVRLTCTFSAQDDDPSGETPQPTFSYEFGSESEHITTALGQLTIGREDADAEPADSLAIGVTDDGIEGVDVESPLLVVQEEYRFSKARFSPGFRRSLFKALKKTNASAWREWEAGEVLLDSISATKQLQWWVVRATFKVRRNQALDLELYRLDGTLNRVTVNKKGWQYLWFGLSPIAEPDGNETKTRIVPHTVSIATVYDETDFGAIFGDPSPLPAFGIVM